MQEMMQAIQIQYYTAPHHAHQDYGGRGYHEGHINYRGQGRRGEQHKEYWRGGGSGQGNSDLTHYL